MLPEELMIGDWVYRPDCYDKVIETRSKGIIGLDSARGLISYSQLKPIPLTPEILEKNGWKKVSGTSYCLHFNEDIILWFRTAEMELVLIGGSTISIKYVHQLQHALRLCGIEKEIEL